MKLTTNSFFFLISALLSFALVRHHGKERRFGPSPANDYTEGSGDRKPWYFFGLGRKRKGGIKMDADPNALPQHTTPDMVRDSYTTDQTRVDDSGGYLMTAYPSSSAGHGGGNKRDVKGKGVDRTVHPFYGSEIVR
jgi:hypothetical protein